MDTSQVPVFLLAGGLGTRMKEQTEFRPKPMVEIGGRPILWHIMRWYSRFGFKKFVICTGFKSEVIKDYFLNYDAMNSDFTVNLASRNTVYHSAHHEEDWEVTVAYTGEGTMTGGRIGRAAAKYLGNASSSSTGVTARSARYWPSTRHRDLASSTPRATPSSTSPKSPSCRKVGSMAAISSFGATSPSASPAMKPSCSSGNR